MIREALARVADRLPLSAGQAREVMAEIMDGAAPPVLIAAYLAALRTKGESVEELTGSAEAIRARAVPLPLNRENLVDTCGTGGDRSGSFNLSSAAALVAAAAGASVVKHGNRAVSGRCGSADFYEALGLRLEITTSQAERSLQEFGFVFCFAPAFHPAMGKAAPVRRELGLRTLFNLLGPVCNPALVRRQVLGVFSPDWIEPMAGVLRTLGHERALTLHGEGLDEFAPWGETRGCLVEKGSVRGVTMTPGDAGLPSIRPGDIAGGTAPQNAERFERILRGADDPLSFAILLNAAAALWISGDAESLRDGARRAAEALRSERVLRLLEGLRAAARGETP